MTDLNKKLDRLQRGEQLKFWSIVCAVPLALALIAYFAFAPADTAFRFAEVIGAQFDADDTGPIWRVEVDWDGVQRHIRSEARPAALQHGGYVCVNYSMTRNGEAIRLSILPAGICRQNGVFEPSR